MRRAIASALRAFAKRVEPISDDARGRNGEGVWTAACDLKVMNLSRSNFDVCHRDGAIEVTIHPQFESVLLFSQMAVSGLNTAPKTQSGHIGRSSGRGAVPRIRPRMKAGSIAKRRLGLRLIDQAGPWSMRWNLTANLVEKPVLMVWVCTKGARPGKRGFSPMSETTLVSPELRRILCGPCSARSTSYCSSLRLAKARNPSIPLAAFTTFGGPASKRITRFRELNLVSEMPVIAEARLSGKSGYGIVNRPLLVCSEGDVGSERCCHASRSRYSTGRLVTQYIADFTLCSSGILRVPQGDVARPMNSRTPDLSGSVQRGCPHAPPPGARGCVPTSKSPDHLRAPFSFRYVKAIIAAQLPVAPCLGVATQLVRWGLLQGRLPWLTC